jgi:hypothetical protein
VLNLDETGWRTNGDKRFLWAFVAARCVVYTVAASRGSEVLIGLLGPVFHGILCGDRFSAYLKYHKGTAQFCWAHLKRNLLGIVRTRTASWSGFAATRCPSIPDYSASGKSFEGAKPIGTN